ncbi:hypothetical protein [Lentzea kentuckyensis]|jgi:hypothetical protein|uniref:hypothetical protein n=1 Tax=Lentzea kentuckyensis TaxID=360086 RepID=UPI001179F245|nr:hypothetical protein [Lentzea kentuckyensis]
MTMTLWLEDRRQCEPPEGTDRHPVPSAVVDDLAVVGISLPLLDHTDASFARVWLRAMVTIFADTEETRAVFAPFLKDCERHPCAMVRVEA